MDWLEISVVVDPEAAEAVAEVLSRYAPQGVAIDLGDEIRADAPVTVRAYLAADDDLPERQHQVEVALWHLGQLWPIPAPNFTPITDRDWTEGWKESIPVLHLSRRIVIKPTWREYTPEPEECVLEMDPGQAFGTGLHPTTRLCMETLEDLLTPGMRVLDLGTGTGILALAAARLGAAEVLAVDNDANAVAVARRNARANAVAQTIRLVHGSLAEVSGAYDLVLANILAPVIIAMCEGGLAARVKRGGALIVSGVLVEQADEVTVAIENAGLHVTDRRQKDDWVALVAYSSPTASSPARRL